MKSMFFLNPKNRPMLMLLTTMFAVASLGLKHAHGQQQEEETVRASIEVLNEIMAAPDDRIPQHMWAGAEGIAIIPRVIKGGFVIGARRGHGTLLVREGDGSWHAPVFVTLTGGSIGWQVGVQSTDVVLVFKTKKSIQGILTKKFTLGVDAAAAAGPVGRQASAATDAQLNAEIYSYARSRGLFLGASFDGSMLEVDRMANGAYYQRVSPEEIAPIPPSAMQLIQQVAAYCGTTTAPTQPVGESEPDTSLDQPIFPSPQGPVLAQQHSSNESNVIRKQLSDTSPELFKQLNPEWRSYLALPAEVFSQQSHPTVEALQDSLRNYEQVVENPQYQVLTSLSAFQSTYGLLRHYQSTLTESDTQPILPPPPLSR